MFTARRTLNDLFRVAVLAVLPLFAGCGGGDSAPADDNDASGPGVITCVIIILATGDTACANSSDSSTTSVHSSSNAAAPNSDSEPLLRQNEELEPNNDLANANLPSYAARTSTGQEIGWYVVGSIDDLTDITDAFAITPNQTRDHVLALCPPESSICDANTGIDTLTAFFRVLDQDGNVLLTSEADTESGNNNRITFDAGMLYYVTVDAGDTMGVTVDYRLFVYEAS
jgi:hypothetical protein